MVKLEDLAGELQLSIWSYLPKEDALTYRLISKQTERATFTSFAKCYFRKRGFMITSLSLGILQKIAEHEGLRKYVQHIWFNPDCYTFVRPKCYPIRDSPDPGVTDPDTYSLNHDEIEDNRDRWNAYTACISDYRQSMHVDKLTRTLTHILKLLPDIQTIGMRRSEDYSPYGWTIYRDTIGEDPRILGPIPDSLRELSSSTKLFLALINALAASAAHVRRFYTDAIEIDNIEPAQLSQTKLNEACHSILYLEINANKNSSQPYHYNPTDAHSPEHGYGWGLQRLLRAIPQLRELGLQIFPDRKQSHMIAPDPRHPNTWRQTYPYAALSLIAHSVNLTNITRLKLDKLTTTPTTLLALLKPSQPTLQSLKLRDIRLLQSISLSEPLPTTSSSTLDSRPWTPVFLHLLATPKLKYLLLYHLLHATGGISFTPDPPLPLPPSETDIQGFPNPAFDEVVVGDEMFAKYEHLALEARGRGEVVRRLKEVAGVKDDEGDGDEEGEEGGHWYQRPIFSYAIDEGVWHTDTSDEEW